MRETSSTKENQVLDIVSASHSCWPTGLGDLWRSLPTQAMLILWFSGLLEVIIPQRSQSLNTWNPCDVNCCLFLRTFESVLDVSLQDTTFIIVVSPCQGWYIEHKQRTELCWATGSSSACSCWFLTVSLMFPKLDGGFPLSYLSWAVSVPPPSPRERFRQVAEALKAVHTIGKCL